MGHITFRRWLLDLVGHSVHGVHELSLDAAGLVPLVLGGPGLAHLFITEQL